MANERKNEAKKDILLFNFIKDNKKYKNDWEVKKTDNKIIQSILDKSSKKKSGNRGEPDLLYVNELNKLLILVENKDTIKQHQSKDGNDVENDAVDGVKHYMSFFKEENINNLSEPTKKYLKNWKVVGIATSGNILDEYNHLISTFILTKNDIKDIENHEILSEDDYVSFFENIDMEKIIREVSESSKRINNKLRSLDSQKRPILLSGLMICLFSRENNKNDFKEGYINWESKTIITNIPNMITQILGDEGIPKDKIEVLTNELAFIKTDQDLNNTNVLKDILEELDKNVIPLFSTKTNYDILGKFYEEFLSNGKSNVKNGIVLTPSHITKLFTDLVEIKNNDVILDTCCGTGAFLISAMNKLFLEINKSNARNKNELIKKIKENQLIGFEKSTTMYALSISNMLFRGDGKSRIFNEDSFLGKSKEIFNKLKKEGINPTIGFINPPYGGQDNKAKPTKKEIQFLEDMLDKVSRYGVIIAPLSTYIREEAIRERILTKHTLKYVINMPKELFQPNASTHTAIAVFKTNIPHNNKNVLFYDLKDDGLMLSKNRGRTDALNKWNNVKKTLFEELKNPNKFCDGIHFLETNITGKDEWLIQAHSKTDYSNLNQEKFIRNIKEYIIFQTKLNLNILNKDIDELTFVELLNNNKITNIPFLKSSIKNNISISKWKWFDIKDLFAIEKGERLVETERTEGDVPLITASSKNNGIVDYLSEESFKNNKKLFENKITIDMFFNVFYHTYKYFSDDNVHTLVPKFDKINLFVMLFIITILRESGYKYAYGRQLRIKRLELEKIKLPIDKKNNPDWKFMENYIKSLPYSSNL